MINKKRKLVSTCLVTMACSLLGATLTMQNASADTETTGRFYMEDGASIRVAEGFSGIRWTTVIENEWFNQNVTGDVANANFGTLVAPKGTTITWEAYKAQQATPDTSDDMIVNVVAGYKQSAGENEDTVYYSVINYNNLAGENNLQEAYALELEAVSYAVLNEGMDTEQVIWAERNDTCRSAKLVANTALYRNEVASADITRAQQYQGTAEKVEVAEELSVELVSAENAQAVVLENVNNNVAYVAIGAQKYESDTFTLTGNELTFNANALTKAKAGETNLAIVYEDGSIENYSFIVATQYIDSAEDLAIFGLGGYSQKTADNYYLSSYLLAKGTKDSFKAQPGYYLVTQDIDASDYVHEYSVFPGNNDNYGDWYGNDDTLEWGFWGTKRTQNVAENKDLTITVGEVKQKGLTGTFDGGGHRITGLTLAGYGLFGVINEGAVVKDVAFMETKVGAAVENTTTYVKGVHTFLAPWVYGAKIENVYAQISDTKNAYGVAAGHAFVDYMRGTTMSNCVVEWNAVPDVRYTKVGSLVKHSAEGSTFDNVYVASSMALSETRTDSEATPELDGENMTGTAISGVRRYETVSVMNAYFAENNDKLQAFDNPTWTIGNGTLQWGDNWALAVEKIDSFSAYKDDAVISQADLQRVFGTTGTVEVLSAAQPGGNKLTVTKVENSNNYKVVGITPNFVRLSSGHIDGVDYVSVNMSVRVDGKIERKAVKVKAYSRIIDEASDLKMFEAMAPVMSSYKVNNQTTWDFSNVEIFDGYYILGGNINASSITIDYYKDVKYSTDGDTEGKGYFQWTGRSYQYDGALTRAVNSDGTNYTAKKAYEMGLTGTFDGAGYTISNLKVGTHGLFPWIGETGWVRNVAFTDASNTTGNTNITSASILASIIWKNAKLSNVYISGSVSAEEKDKGLVAQKIYSAATIENCIFQTLTNPTASTKSFGSLTANDGYVGENVRDYLNSATTWKNVYVISGTVLSNNKAGSKYVYDAVNKVTDGQYSITGVKRYDDVEAMEDATDNDYMSFSDAYWDKTSGIPVWKKLPTA